MNGKTCLFLRWEICFLFCKFKGKPYSKIIISDLVGLFSLRFLLDLNKAVPNHLADESQTEDGPVVYPANAFNSRLQGD